MFLKRVRSQTNVCVCPCLKQHLRNVIFNLTQTHGKHTRLEAIRPSIPRRISELMTFLRLHAIMAYLCTCLKRVVSMSGYFLNESKALFLGPLSPFASIERQTSRNAVYRNPCLSVPLSVRKYLARSRSCCDSTPNTICSSSPARLRGHHVERRDPVLLDFAGSRAHILD